MDDLMKTAITFPNGQPFYKIKELTVEIIVPTVPAFNHAKQLCRFFKEDNDGKRIASKCVWVEFTYTTFEGSIHIKRKISDMNYDSLHDEMREKFEAEKERAFNEKQQHIADRRNYEHITATVSKPTAKNDFYEKNWSVTSKEENASRLSSIILSRKVASYVEYMSKLPNYCFGDALKKAMTFAFECHVGNDEKIREQTILILREYWIMGSQIPADFC